MKYKKVNSGCFDGSPDMMLKPEEVFHPMSPEAVMFRHGIDPCTMLETSTKPLNLAMAAGGSKLDTQYQCYAPTPTTPTQSANAMGMNNFSYPTYYNQLAVPNSGLETMVGQHRPVTDSLTHPLAMASHYQQKYSNNNSMQYHSQQHASGMTHYYASQ